MFSFYLQDVIRGRMLLCVVPARNSAPFLSSTHSRNSVRVGAVWRHRRIPKISGKNVQVHFFYLNNQKFKKSLRKSLICEAISKQFVRANKRRKLNNPLWEQAKTLFLKRKPTRNALFRTCQFKSVHYIL